MCNAAKLLSSTAGLRSRRPNQCVSVAGTAAANSGSQQRTHSKGASSIANGLILSRKFPGKQRLGGGPRGWAAAPAAGQRPAPKAARTLSWRGAPAATTLPHSHGLPGFRPTFGRRLRPRYNIYGCGWDRT